jgi:Nif-specific regulatory protein
VPDNLIEAELFGHEKGAFTGAMKMRRGRFEAAEGGTIFLDEIGELTIGLQVKLLRVLQERAVERLGSNQTIPVDARVICATNRDLKAMVADGTFRADLYYRLNTIEVNIPPLRARRDDISLLAHTFVKRFGEKHNRPASRIAPAAVLALEEYSWPGSVRELQNVMERAVVICDDAEIGLQHLPDAMVGIEAELSGDSFDDEVRNFKRRLIRRTLSETHNNKLQAARSLRIARSSLHRLIEELHVSPPPFDVAN